jgi:hypothetical protein
MRKTIDASQRQETETNAESDHDDEEPYTALEG